MPVGQTLRALVTARLTEAVTAAAEDIFALFERSIAEYEEENKKKRLILDLSPAVLLPSVQVPSLNPGLVLSLGQEILESPQIKEEPEEPLPVPVPGSSAVCVKREEQRQIDTLTEETQGEDVSSETHLHSDSEDTDDDDDWTRPVCCPEGKSTGLFPKPKSAAEPSTSAHNEDTTEPGQEAEERKRQCPVCNKSFGNKVILKRHIRIHRIFSCSLCNKTFIRKENLRRHQRLHSGERPSSCSECNRTSVRSGHLHEHRRAYGVDKPFVCPVCDRSFRGRYLLWQHLKTHTGAHSCTRRDRLGFSWAQTPTLQPPCFVKVPNVPQTPARLWTKTQTMEDRFQSVESKIRDGIYKVQAKYGKSASWSRFNIVVDQDGRQMNYACCKNCNRLVVYSGKSGTSGLRRHVCQRKIAIEHIEIPS